MPLPERHELRQAVLRDLAAGASGRKSVPDALTVCLEALVGYKSYDMSTRDFLRIMHSVATEAVVPVLSPISGDDEVQV